MALLRPRSKKIIITNEARVRRTLRVEHGLSMKRAGTLAGVSDSTIAHIETGRMNSPQGEALERFLRIYGGIKEKSFYERARTIERRIGPKEELLKLVKRATSSQALTLLQVARGLLGRQS